MALDGITIANMVKELKDELEGCRMNKIAQPEPDELMLTVKGKNGQRRLLISASASLPLIYFTDKNKPSPMTAPNFCMLLRKHIGSARILKISQPGLERVIYMDFEHLNEMGDLCQKRLVVELMGKYSNIIFCDDSGNILDSIKHISANTSSVREVLPGRTYFIPETQDKEDPFLTTEESFTERVCKKPLPAAKAIYTSLTGISPVMAQEICYRASVDGSMPMDALNEAERIHLAHTFLRMMEDVREGTFVPNIIYRDGEPVEFAAFALQQYSFGHSSQTFDSMSQVLEKYYAQKNVITRIRQKSADLRHVVQTALERKRKKYAIQQKQMKDTQKKDKFKVYGELINTYGYGLEPGCKSFQALNYYTNEEITIPLDDTLTPAENAKKYFDKYNKLKRTQEALTTQLEETKSDIEHLESISTSLDIALSESDLSQIKEELTEYGYIKRKYSGKKKGPQSKSKPFHYVSSDGYHMYVGKNNFQNEELTFKFATGNDWWFHAKKMPGSHVIVKANNEELPDRTFEEAGRLAAYYSSARMAPKVEIDYIQKKHVKKTPGGKPGFVIYHTNYSMNIEPDIRGIQEIPS
ncbi:MAG: NFACT RNA binding domain-containing protein [Lachnospiraceae bacterium]|nr:NFACT RNA binding domain-containing protein [Lachnospiraceae bacterium]